MPAAQAQFLLMRGPPCAKSRRASEAAQQRSRHDIIRLFKKTVALA